MVEGTEQVGQQDEPEAEENNKGNSYTNPSPIK